MAEAEYLKPYQDAAERHGGGFSALLWASPHTQHLRFEAIARAGRLVGKSILDAGCGRADLLAFCADCRYDPAEYIGLEAVDALAESANRRVGQYPRIAARILRGDFVREPIRLFVGAEAVVFSGSLNTLEPAHFLETLAHAWEAAGETLIFNFLSSPRLAGQQYLHWHEPGDVLRFAQKLTEQVTVIGDYLQGDTTMGLAKRKNS